MSAVSRCLQFLTRLSETSLNAATSNLLRLTPFFKLLESRMSSFTLQNPS